MSIALPREQSSLEIRLFGGLDIRKAAAPLPRPRTRSEQWLLALLVLRHGRDMERSWLAGTLWPESAEEQALYNLRRSLSELRRMLGEDAFRLVSPTSRRIALDVSDAFVDIVAFEKAVAPGDPASLKQAVSLYRGPLLDGCLEEWVLPEQQRFEQAYLTALEKLATHARAQQNYPDAIEYLQKAFACNPLGESILQGLMLSLAESGDTPGALTIYRQFRLRLHNDLQTEPDAETAAIYDRIRIAKAKNRPPTLSHAPKNSPALHRVPHPLTPLIGRETEITKIVNSFGKTRLVTLIGAGGVGKTRLAIAAAHQMAQDYADGVWFLDLAAITDPSQLVQTTVTLLEGEERQQRETASALCRSLANKSLLLILDNCEHLIQACAELAGTVLSRCSKVRILATSRQPLGIHGEQSRRIPCLSLPDRKKVLALPAPTDAALLAQFVQSDAVRLFVEGATAANSAFRLTPENLQPVMQICCLLDGIPFALELASSWVRSLTVAQIAERLDNRFEFLVGGSRTARLRQQTLRAALDWSHQLLDSGEKTLFRRLSLFSGGWTLAAAEAVCAGETEAAEETKNGKSALFADDVLPLLTQLVDKSLVVYEEQEGMARYQMLETTRLYASKQITPAERIEGCRRHARFFLHLARQAWKDIERLGRASRWQARVQEEQENLRVALAWWRTESPAQAAPLLLLLEQCGLLSYHSEEARAWIACLQEADLPCASEIAALYRKVGEWANWLGHIPKALRLWEQSLETATLCADKRNMAAALLNLGYYAMAYTDSEQAECYLQTSQAYFEEIGEVCLEAEARNRRALLALERGDKMQARQLVERSLEAGKRQGNNTIIEDALDILGSLAWKQQDYVLAKAHFAELADLLHEAENLYTANALRHLGAMEGVLAEFPAAWEHLEEARRINRYIGFLPGEGWDLFYMADLAFQQGNEGAAWVFLEESLQMFETLGEVGSKTTCLRRWAQFEMNTQQWERAVCLWSHTERLVQNYQLPVPDDLRAELDAFLDSCRSHLTAAQFQSAWQQGQDLQAAQAIEYARVNLVSRKNALLSGS